MSRDAPGSIRRREVRAPFVCRVLGLLVNGYECVRLISHALHSSETPAPFRRARTSHAPDLWPHGRALWCALKAVLRYAAYTRYPELRLVSSSVTTPAYRGGLRRP